MHKASGVTCAVLQPTFLPWLGWFDILDQSDVLVLLDDVQFSKQSWQQRNRIRAADGLAFVSVPVRTAGRGGQLILDCEISDENFADRMLNVLRENYSGAPFYPAYAGELESLSRAATATGSLSELNCTLIAWIARQLTIQTSMVNSSDIGVKGQRGEKVARICEAVQATRYLSPTGAADYLMQDRSHFDKRGISIWLHEYQHPVYRQQFAPFIPFASTIDLLLNVGPSSIDVLRSGRAPAKCLPAKTDSPKPGGPNHEDR